MLTKMKKNTKLTLLFFILIALDQLAKLLAPQTKTNFLFTYLCNKNIAWNIPVNAGVFYSVWIIIAAILIFIFFKTRSYSQKILLTFIFSGAVSNFIDRIRLGCAVDYIDLKFWPVFNLADVYITIGIIIIVINFIKKSKPRSGLPNL